MKNPNKNVIDYYDSIKNTFSLRPLIKFWEKESANNKVFAASYNYIQEKLKDAPELQKSITDLSIIEKHKELIVELLNICIAPGSQKYDSYAAVFPERLESFYETPAFKRLGLFDNQMNSECFNENCCLTPDGRVVAFYCWILNTVYGLNINYEYPIIYTKIDGDTGLERHYRIRIFGWFLDLKTNVTIKPFSDAEKKRLFENLDNPKVLAEMIPPENFNVEGFFIYNSVEITDHETISSLKFDLIGKESMMSLQNFEKIQRKLRVLLKKPDIKLGLIAFPSDKKDMKNAIKIGSSIILHDSFIEKDIASECEIYSDVLEKQEMKLIYDIKDHACSLKVEEELIKAGIRNLLLVPLIYKDEFIGILEVSSSTPGDLNKVNILKLSDVYPLFAVFIESILDDLNKSVQSVIKEKCTAIHPSVEWRFRDAALRYLNKLRNDVVEEIEEIVFENVQPFYGCSDVKDSSFYRNAAIQADLIENLRLIREIITKASSEAAMPILEELSFRISNQIELLDKGLSSSSEIEVINFIRNEVESTFEYLKDVNPELKHLINTYKEKLEPKFGYLFDKRKDFEESIHLINETISTELDIQQDKAQKIFPHYFEKYKTDGVEYNMYLGSSLVAEKKFNQMHYKSLRLWQLETMCIIAKKCNELKNNLSVPLYTTHLIFVQNAPLSIRFLFDEKKFDVAGSYDIRHEIIKKRIDKAEIKGTKERIVSPGKIAIVYSQESEAQEYKQYIDYLLTKKYITGDVESFELEDLQGVHGLKALRITVNSDFIPDKDSEDRILEQTINTSKEKYLNSIKN